VRRLAAVAVLLGLVFGFAACNGYDNTPNGNSAGLALYTVGTTRASNPPWNRGGFDCWSWVNWVEDNAGGAGVPNPGYHDVTSQGLFTYLPSDWYGANPGDIVTFALNGQQGAYHVGIVTATSPGDFSYASWNSSVNPNEVVVLQHVNSRAPDVDGMYVIDSYLPHSP
jgi:cell wall-associated NlpC family hydrolase